MNNKNNKIKDFQKYHDYVKSGLLKIWAKTSQVTSVENAIPAYIHSNPIISWFFWKRLFIAMDTSRNNGVGKVLDFGCGAGVMFPFLQRESKLPFWACDIDLLSAKVAIKTFKPIDARLLKGIESIKKIPSNSIDNIFALDVLEHIDPLNKLLDEFDRILKHNGHIIVSSPVESKLYQFGRLLSGFSKYYGGNSNVYHKHNAADVELILSKKFKVSLVAKIYPPITMFRVVDCTKI